MDQQDLKLHSHSTAHHPQLPQFVRVKRPAAASESAYNDIKPRRSHAARINPLALRTLGRDALRFAKAFFLILAIEIRNPLLHPFRFRRALQKVIEELVHAPRKIFLISTALVITLIIVAGCAGTANAPVSSPAAVLATAASVSHPFAM